MSAKISCLAVKIPILLTVESDVAFVCQKGVYSIL